MITPSRFALAVLLSAVILGAGGQPTVAQDAVQVGVRGGGTSARFHGFEVRSAIQRQAGPVEQSRHTGVAAGVFATFPLADPLALRPELAYVQKGHEVRFDDPTFESSVSSVSYDADYLQLNVLGQVDLDLGSSTSLFVMGGPGIGVGVNQSGSYQQFGETITYDYEFLNALEVSLIGGTGVRVDVLGGALGLDLRYGISALDASTDGDPFRNGVVTLSVSVMTGL